MGGTRRPRRPHTYSRKEMEKLQRDRDREMEKLQRDRNRERGRKMERDRKMKMKREMEKARERKKAMDAGGTQRREAGLDDLLSDSSSQAGTLAQKAASAFVLDIDTAQPPSDTNTCTEDIRPPLTNADSTSFLDADATQPPSDTLPEGFFSDIHPPPTPPARCSRVALVGRLSSLYCTVRDATLHNMPTPSIPLNLTRSRAILSRYQLRRNQPNIMLERHPKKVEVSYTRGLDRNVRVSRKAKNKHQVPVPLNIMTINVSALSQSTNSNAAMQQSEAAQVQQSSSQLRPLIMMPAASTVTSAAQQSGGAAHTLQPSQAENLLTTTSATATPAAPILTTSTTGPPFRPDFVIRLWTHFRLFLCRIPAEIADNNH